MIQFNIREADLNDNADTKAIIQIIDSYALEPLGGGKPLPPSVRKQLIPGLQRHPTTLVLLAFDEDKSIGLAVCFMGFSTFQAKPLMNLHDFAVLPEYRGKGAGNALLQAVENAAVERGCCKVTLEVLDTNMRAMALYHRCGFSNPAAGNSETTIFLAKPLLCPPANS
jgi:ribosomal protein S18 acetylase RimI-like enzyme